MKTLIVLPAHNEERMIKAVIKDLRQHGYRNILVVDDGSTDNTSTVAKKSKVKVVRHVINRGLGAGLGTGFEYARMNNFDCLVTFDADGQHQAKDIKKLWVLLKKGKCDVVIGSRLIDKKVMPGQRKFLNEASNWITFILYGVLVTDSLSGLRAFNKKAINSIEIRTDRMEVSNEFFKEIRRNKLKLMEVPITTIYTDYSIAHSHNNGINAIATGFKMIIRLFR